MSVKITSNGAERTAILDMLKEICPHANLQVANDGMVSAGNANFCESLDADPPPDGMNKSCKCICYILQSEKNVEIKVDNRVLEWADGRVIDIKDMDGATNGTGSDSKIKVETRNRWRDRNKTTNQWQDVPDWLSLARMFCGQAVPAAKGQHPELRPGKEGYRNNWRDAVDRKENEIRSDHGLPEKGSDHSIKPS